MSAWSRLRPYKMVELMVCSHAIFLHSSPSTNVRFAFTTSTLRAATFGNQRLERDLRCNRNERLEVAHLRRPIPATLSLILRYQRTARFCRSLIVQRTSADSPDFHRHSDIRGRKWTSAALTKRLIPKAISGPPRQHSPQKSYLGLAGWEAGTICGCQTTKKLEQN